MLHSKRRSVQSRIISPTLNYFSLDFPVLSFYYVFCFSFILMLFVFFILFFLVTIILSFTISTRVESFLSCDFRKILRNFKNDKTYRKYVNDGER